MKNRKLSIIVLVCLALLLGVLLFFAFPRHEPMERHQITVTNSDIAFLPTTIVTNSTKIEFSSSKGQPMVRICLFYAADKTESIQEFQLKAGEKKVFGGLCSKYEYAIGVKAETENVGQVTLELDYLPIDSQ